MTLDRDSLLEAVNTVWAANLHEDHPEHEPITVMDPVYAYDVETGRFNLIMRQYLITSDPSYEDDIREAFLVSIEWWGDEDADRYENPRVFFEHGQWFAAVYDRLDDRDVTFSAVDCHPPICGMNIDFEEI